MFLKSIDLFGFKSFADKSHIAFTDGVAALIGPNGCGKSNVVDAVKWVLGEQATRSLRAERMEDVIFNGTETRKPLNVAEVTLTLENDGVLPLDVPEVTIRRRLFRSGESEYFVNGAPVKLKDLRELFYDTGIGKSAYSIMEQGKIDQILSNRPEDRRALFEEAAGITRFKMRGREADRKLERTEVNMREVDTVLSEVRRSYETLGRQAEKTARYRELREQIFHHEVQLQLARLVQYRDQQQSQEEKTAAHEKKRGAIKEEIDGLNSHLEEELSKVNTMESRMVEIQKQLYGIELEKASRQERIALLKDQRTQLDERIDGERTHLKTLTARSAEADEAAQLADRDVQETDAQIADLDAAIAGVTERITRSQDRQKEAQRQISDAEQRIRANDQRAVEIQKELRSVTDELVTALDAELQQSGYSTVERQRAEEAFREALEHMRIALEGRSTRLQDQVRLASDVHHLEQVIRDAFAHLDGALAAVRTAADELQGTIPRFLDDFLAPEGTITRKRTLDDAMEQVHHETITARERIAELTREVHALQETIEKERSNVEQMKVRRVQLQGKREQHSERGRRHRREVEELARQHREVSQRIDHEVARVHALNTQVEKLQNEHRQLDSQEHTLQQELHELEKSIAVDNRTLRQEEERLKGAMQNLAQMQQRLEEAHLRLAEKRTEIRALYDSFQERHGRDLREFESTADVDSCRAADQKALRETIQNTRSALRDLGNVNLMAVEEFAEVKDRFEFLNSQLTDLRTAREDLVKVTAEIRRESEQLFVETYNRIRKNFHTVFRRLFGGGRAELRLMDPDTVLESGIDILVQPPGKKLESIALLSGGERSLTAVALLFATFMVRPSPFTLLDEIDAALDEHNVGRFVHMLREFSEQSQFIVITHNKKTVAGANTLLGVTMQESGVSQVVTVKLDGEVAAG